MKRPMYIASTLLATLALAAMAAAAAQAENAPYWSISGTRLARGKTHFISVKVQKGSSLALDASGVDTTCTTLKVKAGASLLGSEEGEPGTEGQVAEISGCTVTGDGTSCELEGGKLETKPLRGELVEDAATKKKLLVEFKPEKGVTFATVKFAGTCTIKEAAVNGEVLAQIKTDNGSEEVIELGKTTKGERYASLTIVNPEPTKVWLVKAGVGKEEEVEPLEFAAKTAELTGTALIALANSKGETEESAEWTPMP